MAKKDSFILYTEQRAVLDKLTDEQAGKLIKTIYEYVETGIMPELDTVLDLVITPFKTILDKDKAKYEEVSKARAEAGSKGGKQSKQIESKISKNKQKKQLQTNDSNCNDNDNEYVSVNDNEDVNEDENVNIEILEHWESQFKQFYEQYPRKVKKQDVKKWFKKNKPSNELFSSMLNSLEQFRASKDWQKDGGQFIPYPSTWLNQKRWEDEDIEKNKPMSALQKAWKGEI